MGGWPTRARRPTPIVLAERVVAERRGVVGSARAAVLLGDDQVVGRLLTELHELHVPGIGPETSWIATK